MDTIGNFITALRNAELAKHSSMNAPLSKMNAAIARILKENGYIEECREEGAVLTVTLSRPAKRHHYKRLSKPGRRLYVTVKNIPTVLGGRGMVILSTPLGVLSGKEARQKQVGGELICEAY